VVQKDLWTDEHTFIKVCCRNHSWKRSAFLIEVLPHYY